MGKSYVLKNTSGKPIGYIQQNQEKIRIRIQEETQETAIMMFFDNGECVQKQVDSTGEEWEEKVSENQLVGACLAIHGRRLADTGAPARRLYEIYASKSKRRAAPAQSEQPQQAAQIRSEAHVFPQRRWPPHPCCLTARYKHGAWQLYTDSDAIRPLH